MAGYFVSNAGFQFGSSKRELLGAYNKKEDRLEGHTLNDFYDDKVSGELKAARCNCGEYHYLEVTKGKTNWSSVLSKAQIKQLTIHKDRIKKSDTEEVDTPW